MTTSIHWWLHCVLWLFCGCVLTSSVVIVVRGRLKEQLEGGYLDPGWKRTFLVVTGERFTRISTNVVVAVFFYILGMAHADLRQYHRLDSVTNVVIDGQRETYVEYHFERDVKPYKTYAFNFCPNRYLPRFEPHQIVEEMRFVRATINGHECEDLNPEQTLLRLRRLNGVPILAQGE